MSQERKFQIISKIQTLPGISGVATQILALLDDPDSTAEEVQKILRLDPGLTANILKLTNSAYFGLPNKVGSVRQAVVMLGWKRLVRIVLATCVNAVMDKPIPGYDLPPGELWRHSVAVSVTAEGLMEELNLPVDDEIFTAALLHDLGKLIMGEFVAEDLDSIRLTAEKGVPFQMAEREVLGTDHAEIGGMLMEKWSFPSKFVEAVRWHHEPDSAENPGTFIDIVHVANVLCLMLGIGAGIEGLHYQPSATATKRLGLKPRQLEVVASQTLQWVDELSNIFE
ncbi:MAG: HDOD domain-containing protein [Deltaproteobacteria bacterium]|nr:HDOD domain-containing protein [Deltaproteobacteria bacterium]